MAASKDALNLTTRTIDRRARRYRNVVVLVSMVGIVSVVWAVISWSGSPLLGFLTLFPICGGFLVLDTILVNRWRVEILRMWLDEGLDLGAFASTIASIKILPANTLATMLRTLPTAGHPLAGIDQTRDLKTAVMRALVARHQIESDRSLFGALAYSMVLASIGGAIALSNWQSLWGGMAAVVVLIIGRFIGFIRLRRWRQANDLPENQTARLVTFLYTPSS